MRVEGRGTAALTFVELVNLGAYKDDGGGGEQGGRMNASTRGALTKQQRLA